MPLLSLIVTTYNIEDFVEECLDSVLAQTLTDMEIIIVDDGSSDSTPDIIRRYAEKDDRIRPILMEQNTIGGVASGANAGLDAATGEYIGFADGDDYLEPTMFEELVSAAQTYGTDLAMCQYMESVGEEKTLQEPAESRRWDRFPETQRFDLDRPADTITILRFIAVPWRKIYTRKLIEENKIRFPVVDYFWEDNPFHWFTVCSAKNIALVPKVLCYHRVARAGQTMSTRNTGLLKMFGHYETIRIWLSQRGLLEAYHPALLSWAISQFQWIQRRMPGEAGGELFHTMAGIVGPVDEAVFEKALKEKRPNVRRQMRYIRGNRRAFMRHFMRESQGRRDIRLILMRRAAKLWSYTKLVARQVRERGLRSTTAKALRHAIGPRLRRLLPSRRQTITEDHMLRFMVMIQRDMDQKHAEHLDRLAAIEKDVTRLRAGNENG